MLKRFLIIAVCAVFCLVSMGVYTAPETVGVYVEGKRADRLGLSFAEDGTTYVPLGDVSEALGATAVIWDPNTLTMEVEAEGLYISAREGDMYITANGRYLYVPAGVRVFYGRIMVPARVLAKAFGAEVMWLQQAYAVYYRQGEKPISPAEDFYGEEDVYWLSRLVYAEAGGESLEGKIAVGNVVLNRVESDEFPDTVKGVIFDRAGGVQFTPVYTGAVYNDPPEECRIAAMLALDGANTAGGSLYFTAASAAKYSWAARHREVFAQIGNQVFYI